MAWIAPVIGAVVSGAGALSASAKRKKAEKELEQMRSPIYTPNKSILDYYKTALEKYDTNVTDSALYKKQTQDIGQGVTQANAMSNSRRLGGANISSIIQGRNNALLNAAVAGEGRKAAEFNTLGHATQLKASEDKAAFNQNMVAPFERNYNMYAMKASGAAARQNSNMQNLFNSVMSAAAVGMGGEGKGKNNFNNIWGKKRTGDYSYDDSLPVNS